MFLRKKKRKPKVKLPFQNLFLLIALVIGAYAIGGQFGQSSRPLPQPSHFVGPPLILGNTETPAPVLQWLENSGQFLKRLGSGSAYWESIAGEGEPAACGDRVIIHYALHTEEEKELINTETKKQPVTLILGERKLIKGIELRVIGMKEGGVRLVMVPPAWGTNDPLFNYKGAKKDSSLTGQIYLKTILVRHHKPLSSLNCKLE